MVRTVVMCVGVVCSAMAATAVWAACSTEPAPPRGAAQIGAAASGLAGTPDEEFRYTVVDGVPMVGWYAPDGNQVILMRVDSRWVCDLSSGQLKCGERQAAAAPCPDCVLGPCPCSDARCLPLCVANPTVAPGLHDPAAALP